jgi:organic hydroperoxide reductase OsmC/OhrA
MARTHQICPYSKATAGNIDVQLKVAKHPHSG